MVRVSPPPKGRVPPSMPAASFLIWSMRPILRRLRRKLRNLHAGGTNISEFKIDSALSGPLDWSRFPHGEEFSVGMQLICPSLDYLDNVFADIQGGLPPEEPAIMVGTASVLDPSLARQGGTRCGYHLLPLPPARWPLMG